MPFGTACFFKVRVPLRERAREDVSNDCSDVNVMEPSGIPYRRGGRVTRLFAEPLGGRTMHYNFLKPRFAAFSIGPLPEKI